MHPTPDLAAVTDLAARLTRIERENRRWKLGAAFAALVVAVLGACGLSGPAAAPEKEVVAERFVLRGADGIDYATLALDGQGFPALLLQKDKASVFLTVAGPALSLRGADGKRGAFVGVESSGAVKLELKSERFIDGIRMAVQEDGSAGIYVLNTKGRERATIESLSGGSSQLSVRDDDGKVRATMGLAATGHANVLLLDEIGRRRIGMLVQPGPEGTPLFTIEDAMGRPRTELTERFDGTPFLKLNREDGSPAFEAP